MILDLILQSFGVIAGIGLGFYVVGVFNQMIGSEREIDRNFANVDVMLRQRRDEIPRLVEICRGYMTHERSVLGRLVELRTRYPATSPIDAKVVAENDLAGALSAMLARVEAYPELKAQALFESLAKRLTELEDQIADRRELFNSAVASYNTFIGCFPALLLARVFRRARRPLLKPLSG